MIEYTGLFLLDGSTSDPAQLAVVLDSLGSTADLGPEYWGRTERQREPYSADAVQQLATNEKLTYRNFYEGTVILSRTKKLGYKAMLTITDASVGSLKIWFRRPASHPALRRIYESMAELAAKLPLVYGALQPVARKGDEVAGLTFREAILCLEGVFLTSHSLKHDGLTRPAARTWYGPLLGERIGGALLERLGARPCGRSLLVDLVVEPWDAAIPKLFARQSAMFERLRPTGMFAERELNEKGHAVRSAPAPAWIPPEWVLVLRDRLDVKGPLARMTISDDKTKLVPASWIAIRGEDDWVSGGDISGLDLAGADLSRLSVEDANAKGTNLRAATLVGFRARDSDFSNASFAGADLSSAYLFDCDLRGAHFEAAFLNDANLATSSFHDAVFDDADLSGATLAGAWLNGASLRNATLIGASLVSTSLVDTNLTDADLTDANLSGADLRGATLTGATWTRANTTGTRFDPGAAPAVP